MASRKVFCVRSRTVTQAIEDLPDLRRYVDEPIDSCDLLLIAAGFEERVLKVPSLLRATSSRAKHVRVARYSTNIEDNTSRWAELKPIVEAVSDDVAFFDAEDPTELIADVASMFSGETIVRIHVDISGASAPLILSMIGVLADRQNIDIHVTVWYSEAGQYFLPKAVEALPSAWGDDDRPEVGVSNVWAHPIFRGHHHDSAGPFVIAFPSLYTARLARCLSFCEATETLGESNVLWVLPDTTHRDHQWRHQKVKEAIECLLAGAIGGSDTGVIAPESARNVGTHDYRGALKAVVEASDSNEGHNIFLVQFGSKLQSLGSALALAARTEIAAVYARPEKFNADQYSSGFGEVWALDLPNLRSVVDSIQSIGALEYISEISGP